MSLEAVKEFSSKMNAEILRLAEANEAIFQQESAIIHMPMIMYYPMQENAQNYERDYEKEPNASFLSKSNALLAMQTAKTNDPRLLAMEDAIKNPDITIKRGTKSINLVMFKKDKTPYLKKFVHVSDLFVKNHQLPVIKSEEKDNLAKEMLSELAQNYQKAKEQVYEGGYIPILKMTCDAYNRALEKLQAQEKENTSEKTDAPTIPEKQPLQKNNVPLTR